MESLIVDQTWVGDWGGAPTKEQQDTIVSWLSTKRLGGSMRKLLVSFPPFCLVKATKTLEVPCPYSVAIVAGYDDEGRLLVRQDPYGEFIPVSPEDLQVVGLWKGLGPRDVERYLV